MEHGPRTNERRAFQRYQATDRALAMVSRPPASTPFHIIDISRSGLAFRYLGDKMKGNDIAELDLCYNETPCVKGVPVASVADCWTGSNLTNIRRSSLSFKDLSAEQQEQLELFINLYTVEQTR